MPGLLSVPIIHQPAAAYIVNKRWVYNILGFKRYSRRLYLFVFAVLFFIGTRIKKIKDDRRALKYMPGFPVPFQPFSFPNVLFPTYSWWNPGISFAWYQRFNFYKCLGIENVAVYPYIYGGLSIYTSNVEVLRQVTGGGPNSNFIRPAFVKKVLMPCGMNIIAADGEAWQRHRKILLPAFTNDLHRKVWYETIDIYHQMLREEGWKGRDVVRVQAVQKIMIKTALLLVSRCGFGLPFSWSAPPTAPDGTMTIQEALGIFHKHHKLFLFAPKWIFYLPIQWIRVAGNAYRQLMSFMKAEIAQRKQRLRCEREMQTDQSAADDNVFTALVAANEDESIKYKLEEDELIGNVWTMLFAGHETTAHGLSATLVLLAVHRDIQEEIYEEIVFVAGHDEGLVFEHCWRLQKVLGAFYEGLRMFPPAYVTVRQTANDTIIHVPNPPGQPGASPLFIPKGVNVVIDVVGIQNNPRYFHDPDKFLPSRWHSADTEAFFGFSTGTRRCIGRKFAESEAVAFLATILRDWKVEPLLKGGETMVEWERRVSQVSIELTLGLKDVSLMFTRRNIG